MIRTAVFLILVVILVALIGIAQLTGNWHYAVPVEPGVLAYAATFDGMLEDWDQNQGRLSAQALNGVLRLSVGESGSGLYSAARPYFEDFDLRVDARPMSGPEDNGYGVIFRLYDRYDDYPLLPDSWLDSGIVRRVISFNERYNYYLFLVSSDGFYRVARMLNGDETDISTWIESPLVNTGMNVTNRLRVVGEGNQFTFYVNGERVQLCIPDDPNAQSTFRLGECMGGQMLDTLTDNAIGSGRLGVVAQVYTDLEGVDALFEFDNVLVYGPGTPAPTPEATEKVA